jgi:hypothetical protein
MTNSTSDPDEDEGMCTHEVSDLMDQVAINISYQPGNKIAPNNLKTWPDKVYLRREKEGNSYFDLIDHANHNGGLEYLSAEKVREIQLDTVKATLEAACDEISECDFGEEFERVGSLNPQSILDSIKKEES